MDLHYGISLIKKRNIQFYFLFQKKIKSKLIENETGIEKETLVILKSTNFIIVYC